MDRKRLGQFVTGVTAAEPRLSGVEIAQAIDELDLAAALNPGDLSIHQTRLLLALGSGDYGRAVTSLDASLQAHPQSPP